MKRSKILVIAASSMLGVALLGGVAMAGLTTTAGMANTFASLPGPVGTIASHLGPGGTLLEAAAAYIGISIEDLRTELQADKTLTQIAEENGKTRDGLVAAMVAAGQTKLEEAVEKMVDEKAPYRDRHQAKIAFTREMSDAALTYLGITLGEYIDLSREGNSLAEIAESKGLTRDGLVAAMTAAGNALIDQAEQSGRITAEQAAAAREALPAKVETIVDAEKTFGPPFGRGHGPGGRWG